MRRGQIAAVLAASDYLSRFRTCHVLAMDDDVMQLLSNDARDGRYREKERRGRHAICIELTALLRSHMYEREKTRTKSLTKETVRLKSPPGSIFIRLGSS